MEIRRAAIADIDALVENRMDFLREIKPMQNTDALREAVSRYLRTHIADGSALYYICTDKGRIVSSCCLCITETMPTVSMPNGREGLLLNVYTVPDYRRRGLAAALLRRMIEESRAAGVSRITLDYTEDGYPLYCVLGFVRNEHIMQLSLL